MPMICFASPKGGVGKTTLSANVADALRRAGRRVLAIDTDPQNTLRLHFGVSLADTTGFMSDLTSRPDWRMALRQAPSGLLLMPHGTMDLRSALALQVALERDPELLAGPLRAILADPGLLVIVDTAPGPTQALAVMAPMAALVIAVLQADAISAALIPDIDSGRFLGTGPMAALYGSRLRMVMNGVELHSRLSRAAADAVSRHLGPRLLGAISRDETVAEALANQRLIADLAPDSAAAHDIREIAGLISAMLPAPPDAATPPANWGAY